MRKLRTITFVQEVRILKSQLFPLLLQAGHSTTLPWSTLQGTKAVPSITDFQETWPKVSKDASNPRLKKEEEPQEKLSRI
jgi:hypothetical protein